MDWEQEADNDLVKEDEEGLKQMETIPEEEVEQEEGGNLGN